MSSKRRNGKIHAFLMHCSSYFGQGHRMTLITATTVAAIKCHITPLLSHAFN